MKLDMLFEKNALTTKKANSSNNAGIYEILLNGVVTGWALAKYKESWIVYDFDGELFGTYRTKRDALANTGLDWD